MKTRQDLMNKSYDKKRKDAEKYQEREHKDYKMLKQHEQQEYENRKKYDEGKERMDHKDYEEMKHTNPKVNKMMEEPAFKKGGCTKRQKFAMGGAAKVRLNEAPVKSSKGKGNLNSVYY